MNTSNGVDKQQLLSELSQLAQSGQISEAEVLSAMHIVKPEENKHVNLSQVLYYIGASIVFLGICVLVYQNWDSLNSVTKVLVTLGSAIATYVVGALLIKYEDFKGASLGFFLISALLAPLGLYILFDKIGLDTSAISVSVLVFLISFSVFVASFFIFRKIIFTLFSIIFGTALFFVLIQWLVGENFTYSDMSKIWEYRFLVTGLSYMFLGYAFRETTQKALTGVLYGFGSMIFLTTGLVLGGWMPEQNMFWELIYPLLVFGIVFLSVYIKSKSFLVFGSLGLIGYILKITGEYFTEGLGWPLALVLAGLVIMVVGYYAVKINKKYFTTTV